MNDFYTFVVLATVNTTTGIYSFDERFLDTLKTFSSIRKQVPKSKIIFVDNSIEPLSSEQLKLIEPQVDVLIQYHHHLFSTFVNQNGLYRGLGELLMYEQALIAINKNNLLGKRVFKITGRYELKDTFDITFYTNPQVYGKFAFKISLWELNVNTPEQSHQVFFETRLWSFCSSLYGEFKDKLIQNVFNNIIYKNHCIEMAMHECIPHDKVLQMNLLHLQGHLTDGTIIDE
jgi:hypothetical protein